MAEFIAFNPEAEIRGRVILMFSRAMGDRGKTLLKKHGLADVQPDMWYSQQQWLDVLREVSLGTSGVMFDFMAVAKEISRNIPLPDDINSVEAVLFRESDVYKMNNRNCDGHFTAELIEPGHMFVTVCNPYPKIMMYGIVWGLATRFEPNATVYYHTNNPCTADNDCCVYDVRW